MRNISLFTFNKIYINFYYWNKSFPNFLFMRYSGLFLYLYTTENLINFTTAITTSHHKETRNV